MTGVAEYARRLAVLPRALAILELHPEGLPLADLADELGVEPAALREVVLAYYRADLVGLGQFDQPVVEFFGSDSGNPDDTNDRADKNNTADDVDSDDEVDPTTADWIRVVAPDPEQELGVDLLSAEQLARLHRAGADLLALEQDNEVLRSALDAFHEALWPADDLTPDLADAQAVTARAVYQAVGDRRRVRIHYVRQWRPGGGERVIEPYRMVRTRRGWEIDAGPADHEAAVRTYLVSGITDHEVLDERFDVPEDLDARLAAQRAPTTVEVVVPQDRRWAVERYAETVVVLDDDEASVLLRVELLPPVLDRLGLMMLVCGPEAFVASPRELAAAGEVAARRLLEHHRG